MKKNDDGLLNRHHAHPLANKGPWRKARHSLQALTLVLGIAFGLGHIPSAQALGGLDELAQPCPENLPVIPVGAPPSCNTLDNSAADEEILALPGIGFLNGLNCVAYPQTLSLSDASDAIEVSTDYSPRKAEARFFAETASEDREAIVFGSARDLQVGIIPWGYNAGLSEIPIAVNLETGAGIALEHSLLCPESAVHNGQDCAMRAGVINGFDVKILARVERDISNERRAVALIAPRIGLNHSVEVNVNLLVTTSDLYPSDAWTREGDDGGGDDGSNITLSAVTGGTHFPIGTDSDWRQVLHEPPVPPWLTSFVQKLDPHIDFNTTAIGRLEKLTLYTPSMAGDELNKEVIFEDENNKVLVSLTEALDPKLTWNQTQWQSTGLQGMSEVIITHNAHEPQLSFRTPPTVRRKSAAGGVTHVVAGSNSAGVTPNLSAQGVLPIEVNWEEGDIATYANAIVTNVQGIPLGCGGIVPDPEGSQTCYDYTDCELGYPDCTGDIIPQCYQNFVQECHVLGAMTASFQGFKMTQYAANMPQMDVITNMKAHINEYLEANYPKPEGPVRTPQGDTRWEHGHYKMNFAAHAMTRGKYFESLFHHVKDDSMRYAVPVEGWQSLAQSSDHNVFGGDELLGPDHYGIDLDRLTEARRWNSYVKNPYVGGQGLFVNALGKVYGREATGWRPDHLLGDTYGSWLDLKEIWEDLATYVGHLHAEKDQLVINNVLNSLIAGATAQLNATVDVSNQLVEASEKNLVDQNASLEALTVLSNDVQSTKNTFEQGMVTTWSCPSFEECPIVIAETASEIAGYCPEAWGIQDILDFAGSFVGYVNAASAVISVLDGIEKIQPALDASVQIAEGIESFSDVKDLEDGLEWLSGKQKELKSLSKHAKILSKVFKQISEQLSDPLFDCEGTPVEAQITALKSDIVTFRALNDTIAAQAGHLEAAMSAIAGHITYLTSGIMSLEQYAVESARIVNQLSALGAPSLDDFQRRRDFITAACQTTRVASLSAMTQLHSATSAQLSTAGRTRTQPGMVVPRSPSASQGAQTDARFGYALSLWDLDGYESMFSPGGGQLSNPVIDQAANRFEQSLDQICNASPKRRVIVRKVVQGDDLERFLSEGKTTFNVDLDDLIIAGNNGSVNLSAISAIDDVDGAISLAAPYVINVGYSACLGEDPVNPCCSGAGCRVDLAFDAPAILPRALVMPSQECSGAAESPVSTEEIAGHPGTVSTCMRSLAFRPASAEMAFVENADALNSPAMLDELVESSFCNIDPDVLALRSVSGYPLFGAWAIAANSVLASGLNREMLEIPAPIDLGAWQSDNSSIIGIEIIMAVGFEGLVGPGPYHFDPSFALEE